MQAEVIFPIFVAFIVSFALFAKSRVDFWARKVAESHNISRKRGKRGSKR